MFTMNTMKTLLILLVALLAVVGLSACRSAAPGVAEVVEGVADAVEGVAPASSETDTPEPVVEGAVSPSESAIPTYFATYTDNSGFFSVSHPPAWEVFPSRLEGVIPFAADFFSVFDSDVLLMGLFFVFYVESPAESDGSRASVNIVVQSVADLAMDESSSLDEIVEAKLQRTEEIRLEYHEFSRVNTLVGGMEAVVVEWENSVSDSRRVRTLQMFTITDGLLWKVTGIAASERYDTFEDDFHAIVGSLRMLR